MSGRLLDPIKYDTMMALRRFHEANSMLGFVIRDDEATIRMSELERDRESPSGFSRHYDLGKAVKA